MRQPARFNYITPSRSMPWSSSQNIFTASGHYRRKIPTSRRDGVCFKGQFSRSIGKGEPLSQSRAKRGERGIWQRRFWEHLIRDEDDFNTHIDYIHWNPIKHGWAQRVADWPYSSFHAYVKRGIYSADWGDAAGPDLAAGE